MAEVKEKWVMPIWMEPYRELFNNTGDHTIEHIMNDCKEVNIKTNAIMALICAAVGSQVKLLYTLHNKGLLK